MKPEHVNTSTPLRDIRILEVGCGAGILTEQLARLNARVTAIDPGHEVIETAKQHLKLNIRTNINQFISYETQTLEAHLEQNPAAEYDAVVVSEVLEHVNEKQAFLEACTRPLKVRK